MGQQSRFQGLKIPFFYLETYLLVPAELAAHKGLFMGSNQGTQGINRGGCSYI